MFIAIGGGIIPVFKPIAVIKVFDFGGVFAFKAIYYYKLYLHFFSDNAFYINTCLLTERNIGSGLGKSCKVGGQLNENAVILNTSYNARYGLPRGK